MNIIDTDPALDQPGRDLEWLDDHYTAAQDRIDAALRAGDTDAARRFRDEADALAVIDADGFRWQVWRPHLSEASAAVEPRYRFDYRYSRSRSDESPRIVRRSRFVSEPSLAKSYADGVGGRGWLPWVVGHSEPLAYASSIAVVIGLWYLLGDYIGSLPGPAILAALVVFAAGLWVSTVGLMSIPYREAERLSHLTRAVAIGVTAGIPWVATIDASSVSPASRLALTSVVAMVAAAASFARIRSSLTYSIAVGAWLVAAGSIAIVVADVLYDDPDRLASARVGIVMAAAIAVPVATRVAFTRWIPATIAVLGGAASLGLVITLGSSPTSLHVGVMVVLGAAAASSLVMSSRALRPRLRWPHRIGAMVVAAFTLLVLLAELRWDWLDDVPLPVILLAAGSLVLVAISIAIRLAVARVGAGNSTEPEAK